MNANLIEKDSRERRAASESTERLSRCLRLSRRRAAPDAITKMFDMGRMPDAQQLFTAKEVGLSERSQQARASIARPRDTQRYALALASLARLFFRSQNIRS